MLANVKILFYYSKFAIAWAQICDHSSFARFRYGPVDYFKRPFFVTFFL